MADPSSLPPVPSAPASTDGTSFLTPLGPMQASAPLPAANAKGNMVRVRLDSERAKRFVAEEAQVLLEARAELARDLQRLPVARALQRFTQTIDQMIERIAAFIEEELGPPPLNPDTARPVAYQLFAAGSYARAALSPYSDVDYGLLIERDGPEVRAYFRQHTERLGEILAAVDPVGALHPCDLISPTGAAKDALIDTPTEMAKRAALELDGESDDATKTVEYVTSALNATRPVFARHGGQTLHDELVAHRERELGSPAPNLDPRGQRAALVKLLLRSLRVPFGVPKQVPGTFGRFVGQAPEAALEAGRVNVKHDLFKALYFPVVTLAALYGVQEVGIPEILRTLESKNQIPKVLAARLEEIYEALIKWRSLNHVAHGKSEDVLEPLEDHHVRAIRRMIPILFRLEQSLSRLADGDPNRFSLGARA